MASNSNLFKTYQRNRRELTIETNFDMGMMFTNGVVEFRYVKLLVNYNMLNSGTSLVPRPGLRLNEIILPDLFNESIEAGSDYHEDEDVSIKAAKDCVEDGVTYRQFILGKADPDGVDSTLWVCTSEKSEETVETVDGQYSVGKSLGKAYSDGDNCTYNVYSAKKIHSMAVDPEIKFSNIIGTFAFGNNFYYLNPVTKHLMKTVFDEDNQKYVIKDQQDDDESIIKPKELDPSEAVAFGYNMLQGESAYTFVNEAKDGNITFTGILPYSKNDSTKLRMTPKKNERIYFRVYFNAKVGYKYKFVLEWRTVDKNDWDSITLEKDTYTIVDGGDGKVILNDGTSDVQYLQAEFKAPANEIMVRVQAFRVTGSTVSEDVEQAMNMGFDFRPETYGLASNVEQESYDLITASGMTVWKNRLVLWGVPKDPSIMFVSDVNEPSYFPYPNNISIFDEPIVDVKAYMDSLLVFTVNSVYQVTLTDDGVNWNSVLVQSNLSIEPFDKHLIQVVRNMVFFKSGNYYYMIVPKAQSTTGELTLAPVSNPIVEFFNNFEVNIAKMLTDVFDYKESLNLVNFYNFLDYEDVHNMYVFKYEDEDNKGYLHVDVLYNTVSRVWKIYTFESVGYLYPYKHDATQTGTLAVTSVFDIVIYNGEEEAKLESEDCYAFCSLVDSLVISDVNFEICNIGSYTPFNGLDIAILLAGDRLTYSFRDFEFDYENDLLISTDSTGYVRLEYSLTEDQNKFRLIAIHDDMTFDADNFVVINNVTLGTSTGETYNYTVDYTSCGGLYRFTPNILNIDSMVYINNAKYILRQLNEQLYVAESGDNSVLIIPEISGYYFIFYGQTYLSPSSFPNVKITGESGESEEVDPVSGRVIELLKFDELEVKDFYLNNYESISYINSDGFERYDDVRLTEVLTTAWEHVDDLFLFKNWQFIDTGYRDDSLERKKRYREVQLQLNNIEGADLNFGFSFILDGQERYSYYQYDVEHIIDENDPNYGLIYILGSPYMNLNMNRLETPNETILGEDINAWSLNQSLFPEVSLWKIRAHVTGKGAAPRMKLLSRNENRFEIMNINWVCRYMNTR